MSTPGEDDARSRRIYTREPRKHERGLSSAVCVRRAAISEPVNSPPFRAQSLNYERDETALSNSWYLSRTRWFSRSTLRVGYSQISRRGI